MTEPSLAAVRFNGKHGVTIVIAEGSTMTRYLEERTGLTLHRLCGRQRFGAGVAILLTGVAVQIASYV